MGKLFYDKSSYLSNVLSVKKYDYKYEKEGFSQVAQGWKIFLPMQEVQVQPLGQKYPLEKKMAAHSSILKGFPGGSEVKNQPAMWEIWVWSLGLDDPLEKEMATHSSILTQKIPWTEGTVGIQSTGLQKCWT